MLWFGKIKQLNTANLNVDVRNAKTEELDELIPGVGPIDRSKLVTFCAIIYNELLTKSLKETRKFHEKNNIGISYSTSATAIALIEVSWHMVSLLKKYYPMEFTVLKRHIQNKVASWD